MLGGDQRAELGRRVDPGADLHRVGGRGRLLGELVGARCVDEEARVGDADLAGVEERALQDAADGGVEVGVVEDHGRRLAAELQAHPLQVAGGRADDRAPDLGRAGEGDLVDAAVLGHRLADGRAAGDDVEDAVRDAGLLDQLREAKRRSAESARRA